MRYAPIMPVMEYTNFSNTTHFCFAEFALRDEAYASFYRIRGLMGDIVIMDTLVYEGHFGSSPMDDEDWLEAVKKVQPTYAIIPDVFGDKDATLERFFGTHLGGAGDSDRSWQWIGVPQGHDIESWVECARLMSDAVEVLGIPTRTPHQLDRSTLINVLISFGLGGHKFHLLGSAQMSWKDDIICSQIPQVISLDSKQAISAAMQGINLEAYGSAAMHIKYGRFKTPVPVVKSRVDFFECKLTHEQLWLAEKNVRTITSWLV